MGAVRGNIQKKNQIFHCIPLKVKSLACLCLHLYSRAHHPRSIQYRKYSYVDTLYAIHYCMYEHKCYKLAAVKTSMLHLYL